MSPVVAGLIPLIIIALAFDVFCLVDLVRAEEVRYLPRWAWAVVIVCVSAPLGGMAYLVAGKPH